MNDSLAGISSDALIKRAFIFLEDGDFERANQYLEQALNQEPENCQAYLGKLIVERNEHTIDDVVNIGIPLEDEKLFKRALQFANDAEKAQLEGYIQANRAKVAQWRTVEAQKNDNLIKRAFLAIEEGEFQEADSYLDQVLDQASGNSNAYLGKLMTKLYLHKPEDLTNLTTPLGNEEFFRQALRYADGEAKAQLEGYLQANRAKIEQLKAEKAAQLEQERAALEAQKEEQRRQFEANEAGDINELDRSLDAPRPHENESTLLGEKQESSEPEKENNVLRTIAISFTFIAVLIIVWRYSNRSDYSTQSIQPVQITQPSQPNPSRNLDAKTDTNKYYQTTQDFFTTPERNETQQSEDQTIQAEYSQAESSLNAKDYTQALDGFIKLANQGFAPAQDKMGWMYQNGWGVPQDYRLAAAWYRKAAEQGNVAAQTSLGRLYYMGLGVPKDKQQAMEWSRRAAEQGNQNAKERYELIRREIEAEARKQQNLSPDSQSSNQVEELIAQGKVPMYVRDRGRFFYNPNMKMVRITGDNVRLRSQPNMEANVIGRGDREMWGSIEYLGEWTHPNGSRWVVGLYDDWDNYPADTPEWKKKVVWIAAQYAQPITMREYQRWQESIRRLD